METFQSYVVAFSILIMVMFLPNQTTMDAVNSEWYKSIRPKLTPPNYVFPIVWTTLYFLIAVALAQTLQLPYSNNKNMLLFLYGFNLTCNVLWSYAYFGSRDLALALVILGAIIVSAAFILYYTYWLLPGWVTAILVPYQLWILFAFYLNAMSLRKMKV